LGNRRAKIDCGHLPVGTDRFLDDGQLPLFGHG
jgi:hypothetical protein